MKRALLVVPAALLACGGPQVGASGAAATALALAPPDVELRDAVGSGVKEAVVGAKTIPMDGVAEGLAWPALRAAVTRKPGEHGPLTISIARSVPMSLVMRAVWTLRDADLRLQTPDAAGAVHALELRPKPDTATPPTDADCHLAVFVGQDGSLRVAAPGGPHAVAAPDASGALARALAVERTHCTIRYVAFGTDAPDAPWSTVFDVAETIDREKSAGDARYVLGEPVHADAH